MQRFSFQFTSYSVPSLSCERYSFGTVLFHQFHYQRTSGKTKYHWAQRISLWLLLVSTVRFANVHFVKLCNSVRIVWQCGSVAVWQSALDHTTRVGRALNTSIRLTQWSVTLRSVALSTNKVDFARLTIQQARQVRDMQNNAEGTCRPHPFSIAAILGDEITANNVQPEKKYPVDEYARDGMQEETEQIMMPNIRKDENQSNQRIIASEYSWLHCSRYNPPKVHSEYEQCFTKEECIFFLNDKERV